MLAFEQLGQREVVPALRRRAGAHRVAEAEPARLGAVDGDDEDPLAARRIVAVDVPAAGEHAILNPDCGQVAAAHSEERERLVGRRLLLDLRDLAVPASAPQPHTRREQELLPRVRPDGESEARLIVARLDAVRAGVMDLGPARRKLVGRFELVVDDRPVPERRADDSVAAGPKRVDELVQPLEGDHALGCRRPAHSCENRRSGTLPRTSVQTPTVHADFPQREEWQCLAGSATSSVRRSTTRRSGPSSSRASTPSSP